MGIYGTKKDIKLGKLELSGNNIYYITSASGEAARQQTKEIFDISKRNSNASSTFQQNLVFCKEMEEIETN